MLNLGFLERKGKGKTGGAEDLNGLLPIFESLSQQRILCHNREFSGAIENTGPMLRLWSSVMIRSLG